MTNPFNDIERFATACDQPASPENYKMYLGLIDEEYGELVDAVVAEDKVELSTQDIDWLYSYLEGLLTDQIELTKQYYEAEQYESAISWYIQ